MILPETVQSTYEENILYYQNKEYHVFCGKVYKRGDDNEFSLFTDNVTLNKNCREFNIVQSSSRFFEGYVYHKDPWYGKVFWLPDNSQRYFNGTKWITVPFRTLYTDINDNVKYFIHNNQLHKTKNVQIDPNDIVINCETNELYYANTNHELRLIIDRDTDHVQLDDGKIKRIMSIKYHSKGKVY